MMRKTLLSIALLLLCVALGPSACGPALKGSGTPATNSLPLPVFTQVLVRQALTTRIDVQPGAGPRVEISGDENLLGMVSVRVEGSALVLDGIVPEAYAATWPLTLRLVTPVLSRIDVSGASRTTVSGVQTETLAVISGGSSSLSIEGTAPHVTLTASGASHVAARGLRSGRAEVFATGSASIEVCATEDLTIYLVGTSTAESFCGPARSSGNVDYGSVLTVR